jgi:hypothetical protein
MPRFIAVVALTAASLTLTGCSVFYPNWGATSLPEPTETIAEQPVETQSAEPEQTESAEPEPTETATEEEPTEAVKRKEVEVEVIMAVPEPDYGILTVVAQIPGLSESGGTCIFKFIGGETEKTLEVKAEPSSDYTQCFPIEYPLAELPNGNGVVTVSYESEGHFGTSTPVSVVIG